jgi:hypothetical protein
VKIRAEDIAEIRRHAEKGMFLDDDSMLLDQMNELVEARIDMLMWEFWDFDWNGVAQDDLFALIRSTNPAIIPEIPGQMGLGDLLDMGEESKVRKVDRIEPKDFV